MKKKLLCGILSIGILTACKKELTSNDLHSNLTETQAEGSGGPQIGADEFVPGELLVQFKQGMTPQKRGRALGKVDGLVKQRILTKAMERSGDHEGLHLVKTTLPVLEAISRLKGDPNVEFAEPNYILRHTEAADDSYYTSGSLWGMYGPKSSPANQFGSQATTAWANGHIGSSQVIVGVIDEGIDFNHPDLDANIWTNPFDPLDGLDNDNNGKIDDTHGWDFANADNTIFDGAPGSDIDKHGTHVAGTIGAESNGKGVVGINWNVKIISSKFLGPNGGMTANAVSAIDYLTDLKIRYQDKGLNIVASNNSWGGGGFSQAIFNAVSRQAIWNILFIAAAGNSGMNNDAFPNYPSNYNTTQNSHYPEVKYDNVIAVAALNSDGSKASYSNYGSKTVDLGAPGSGIYSTLPFDSYGSFSGTSMATPHVTGAAALYASTNGIISTSSANAVAIRDAIFNAAKNTPTKSMSRKVVTSGRLNASAF